MVHGITVSPEDSEDIYTVSLSKVYHYVVVDLMLQSPLTLCFQVTCQVVLLNSN